jgi:hypothetical protein
VAAARRAEGCATAAARCWATCPRSAIRRCARGHGALPGCGARTRPARRSR